MKENRTDRPLRLRKESLRRLSATHAQEEDATGPGPVPTGEE